MDPQYIKIFLAIAEHQSISAAAKFLHFSQPTVSEHLSQLEHKLGIQLVQREKGLRRVTLTAAGQAFLPLAQRHRELQEMLNAEIAQFVQSQAQKNFRLAASYAAHQHITVHIIHKMMQHSQDVNLQLSNVEFWDIPKAVNAHALDAVFVFTSEKIPTHPWVTTIPLFREPRYILCPADTPLPERTLALEDLDPCFEVSYTQSNQVQQWHQQNFPEGVKPYFEYSLLTSAHNYLTDPHCWTVVPALVAKALAEEKKEQLTIRHLEPAPPPRYCSLLISKTYPHKDILDDFLQYCDEYIRERPYLQKLSEDKLLEIPISFVPFINYWS